MTRTRIRTKTRPSPKTPKVKASFCTIKKPAKVHLSPAYFFCFNSLSDDQQLCLSALLCQAPLHKVDPGGELVPILIPTVPEDLLFRVLFELTHQLSPQVIYPKMSRGIGLCREGEASAFLHGIGVDRKLQSRSKLVLNRCRCGEDEVCAAQSRDCRCIEEESRRRDLGHG